MSLEALAKVNKEAAIKELKTERIILEKYGAKHTLLKSAIEEVDDLLAFLYRQTPDPV